MWYKYFSCFFFILFSFFSLFFLILRKLAAGHWLQCVLWSLIQIPGALWIIQIHTEALRGKWEKENSVDSFSKSDLNCFLSRVYGGKKCKRFCPHNQSKFLNFFHLWKHENKNFGRWKKCVCVVILITATRGWSAPLPLVLNNVLFIVHGEIKTHYGSIRPNGDHHHGLHLEWCHPFTCPRDLITTKSCDWP